MPDYENFDWSVAELYEPIWLGSNLCVCLDGVPMPTDAFALKLHSSKVFGTGGHPASRAAVLKLIHKELDPAIRVVDFECGTGLLGILCAKFGCDVHHVDDSKEACELALRNGILNEVVANATLLKNSPRVAPADLLVTHQGSLKTVKKHVRIMHNLLKGGGTLILSGHTAWEHRAVKSILTEFFEIEQVDELETWGVITARK